MKKTILSITASILFLLPNFDTYAQGWKWAKNAGGTGAEFSAGTATDASGNIYTAGSFGSPTITFGGFTLTNANSLSNNGDVFLTKYDSSGNVLWARSAGGQNSEGTYGIATDAFGNVLITGYFNSPTITFDTFTLTNVNALGNTGDIYVVKYNSTGTVVWAKSYGGIFDDYGMSVTTDASGKVYLTGYFASDAIMIGTTTLTNASPGQNYADVLIAKLDSAGNNIWAKSGGGDYVDIPKSISVDKSLNVYVAGSFSSSSILFGTVLLPNATLVDTSNIFLVKYDPNGNVLWAKTEGGARNDFATSVTVGASGAVYLTGVFQSQFITFGSTLDTNHGTGNMFLIKYDTSGDMLWSRTAGGNGYDGGNSIITDATENIYMCGWFTSYKMSFGRDSLNNAGGEDLFLAKYSTNGDYIWSKAAGSGNTDLASGIAIDAESNIYMSGYYYSSSITFGATALINTGSYSDLFLAKYNDGTAAVEDVTTHFDGISLYPNPTTGQITLKGEALTQVTDVQVFDMLGRQVSVINLPSIRNNELNIELPEVPNGNYILHAISVNKSINLRFVVNR